MTAVRARSIAAGSLLAALLLTWSQLPLRAADPGGEHYAFLVGVRKYPPTKFRELPGAENDVVRLADVLKARGVKAENIVLLTNTRGADDPRYLPLAENIRRELNLLLERREANDVVLIGLAGHGVQPPGSPYYFCPFDADLNDSQTLISIDDVYKELQGSPAGLKLLFVDACRENPFAPAARATTPVDRLPDSVTLPTLPDPPGGVAAFFSCSKGQVARERVDVGVDGKEVHHGIFFHAVIEALEGKAADEKGETTVPDLEKYVKRQVETYARVTYSAKQHPDVRNQTRGLFALFRLAAPLRPARVLFVTQCLGFRHGSVTRVQGELAPAEIALIQLGQQTGVFQVDCTQDCAADFTSENLKNYDVVALYGSGDLPIAPQDLDYFFNAWLKQKGHGVLGFHSAVDTFHNYEPYWRMIGGTFLGHPWNRGSRVILSVHEPEHPCVRSFGKEFSIQEEIYMYRNWQPGTARVLMSLDYSRSPTSASVNTEHGYHVPVCWVKEHGDGRVYFNSLGHSEDTWTNKAFLESIASAVKWIRGLESGTARPNPEVSAVQEEKARRDFEGGFKRR